MAGKALICDLDGTLWDSYPCYAAVLERIGGFKAADALQLLKNGGNFVQLARKAGKSNSKITGLCTDCIGHLKLYPGVREALASLRTKRIPLGIVTNLPGWFVAPLLDQVQLSAFFGATVGSANKPSPAGLLNAVAMLNGKPGLDVFYIGDTDKDGQAAQAAGVSFGWATYGYGGEPEGPHVKIRRFQDVLKL